MKLIIYIPNQIVLIVVQSSVNRFVRQCVENCLKLDFCLV